MKPKVFVGSSGSSLPLAKAFADHVKDCAEAEVWEGYFGAGKVLFTELLESCKHFHFAVFIFGKDDLIQEQRGKAERHIVRDNVLFEFGLFLGTLGAQRTYFVPAKDLAIPADLLGLLHLRPFNSSLAIDSERDPEAAKYCIKEAAEEFKAIARKTPPPLTGPANELKEKLGNLAALVEKEAGHIQHQFRFQLLQDVVSDLQGEIREVLKPTKYSRDITLEAAFLVRARELFAQSDGILAVSLDRFSTFWLPTDDYNRSLVEKYIQIQPKRGTKRLFIFSDPRSAAQHRHVLRKHFEAYGKGGGVYLCSWAAYRRLLTRVFGVESEDKRERVDSFSEKDFAILRYRNPLAGRLEKFLATLSSTSLEYEPLTASNDWIEPIESALAAAMSVEEGSWHDASEILRWAPIFSADRDETHWKRELERMFQAKPPIPGEEEGDVMHFVFFKEKVSAELPTIVTDVIDQLAGMHSRSHGGLVKDVWFGKHTQRLKDIVATDGATGGKLITENTFVKTNPYCLIVRLDGAKQLEEYYKHINHSEARVRIQKSFGDKVIDGMHQNLVAAKSPEEKKKVFQQIENAASLYMTRADYMRDVDIGTLIRGARTRFGV